ncbi:hypothetical protein ACIHFB_07335 [Streptomyces sp. NPDC051963]|uniref:hypothetical protein n=1 Tax=Streptomyces sp. NPDC051963 TaxID=3365678 RepID=UPI0037D46E59
MTIQAGDATAETIDDLRDANKRELRTVRLITSGPQAVVVFGDSPVVRTTEQDQVAIDLVDDIAKMLRPRMSFGARHRRLMQTGALIFTLGGMAISFLLVGVYKNVFLMVFPYIVLLGGVVLINRLTDGRADIIPLLPREAREERAKQRNLLIAGVFSFIGGLGVAALTFYLGWKR